MSGVVLALVEHPDVARQTLAAASNLAKLMGSARINVLAIREPPDSSIMFSEEIPIPPPHGRPRPRTGAGGGIAGRLRRLGGDGERSRDHCRMD